MKIAFTNTDLLIFDDGEILETENIYEDTFNYADFTILNNTDAMEFNFKHPLLFEKCKGGFKFGNKDNMFFVPCYLEQDTYYHNFLKLSYSYSKSVVFDDIECVLADHQRKKRIEGKDIKIKTVEEELLVFDDETTIRTSHLRDCCEYNYADFTALENTPAMDATFRHPLVFEKCEHGFRFGNKGNMFFVPCYSVQSGYYSFKVDVYYDDEQVFDDVNCEWWLVDN